MEPLWLFSAADNSIDLVGGIIFALVLYRACWRLYKNALNIQGKILLGFFAVISFLHVFQVIAQFYYGGPIAGITFRIWDFINYLTAIVFLFGVERINIRERHHETTH